MTYVLACTFAFDFGVCGRWLAFEILIWEAKGVILAFMQRKLAYTSTSCLTLVAFMQ